MRVSEALPISLLGAAIALAGCSGGAQSDGRLAAIQTALDAHPPFINVPNGTVCHLDVYWPAGNYPSKFKGLSYVTVKPAGVHRDMFSGTEPCTTVTWDASAHFTPQPGNEESGTIPIGRFIVDKVGDEQDGPSFIFGIGRATGKIAWQKASPNSMKEPKPGDYRIYVQVKRGGAIVTGVFDARVEN